MANKTKPRKGQPSVQLSRQEFVERLRERFRDPAYRSHLSEFERLADVAWDAYDDYRKSPIRRRAGAGFKDPDYELPVEWLETRKAIIAAGRRQRSRKGPSRILLICGAARNDQTCPGEMSKSFRLAQIARREIERQPRFECDFLDLSRLTAEYGRQIHPCKSCVSTAMPLCHWPCSCYPNYSLGQTDDWMNEIYPLWVAAHGILIVAPVNWYHASTALKAMMDRLVCADGGNPDPTSTHGKHADEAKALELAGWPYPRHLAGRLFSAVVHGDTIGAETLRRGLMDWAADMHLTSAGARGEVDGYVGYYEPYATSHQALDRDEDFQQEVRNAAIALRDAVVARRNGKMIEAGAQLPEPRPK